MPVFSFEATDGKGKVLKQDVEAANRDDAIAKIRSMGYYPTKVSQKGGASQQQKAGVKRAGSSEEEVAAKPQAAQSAGYGIEAAVEEAVAKPGFFTRLKGGVSTSQLANFTVQLGILLEAGLPIVRSLRILQGQYKGALSEQVKTIADDVEGGASFSEALSHHPGTFNRLYISMVRAGEAGGVLDVIMKRLGDFLEKSVRLKRRVIGAMIYPAVVILVAVAVLGFVMAVIIPKFKKMFEEFGIELPAITQFLLSVSGFVVDHWYLLVFGVIGLVALYKLAGASGGGRTAIDKFKMSMPLVGDVIKKAVLARFSRTLGTLIGSGVPILQALQIVKEAIGNSVIEGAVENVTGSIKEGETIAEPLRQSGVFDEIFVNMIDVGEETGELDKMLNRIADNYEEEVDVKVESLMSVLEPVMIVCLGVVVGIIVVALFMPLMSIIAKLT
ncbi:MAG: type II secretion system F family protein [Planctomycetota bacterium]|nr:type II secretion system F family protein [Planctomycetota bacterium]